jgi:hypothetical protein
MDKAAFLIELLGADENQQQKGEPFDSGRAVD